MKDSKPSEHLKEVALLFLPGATGVTLIGYIGHKMKRFRGGILAPFAFAFPAMVAITVLAWAYFNYGNLRCDTMGHSGWRRSRREIRVSDGTVLGNSG